MTIGAGTNGQLTALKFWELSTHPIYQAHAPTNPISNNYPEKYGVRVLKNGAEIFKQTGLQTSTTWSLEHIDFSGDPDFNYSPGDHFEFELYAYDPVGNGNNKKIWDLDEISLEGCCTACENVSDGGTIASSQSNCGPFTPSQITSTMLPIGGYGTLEYKWIKSTSPFTSNNSNGTIISGATGVDYQPGNLTQTTYFKRLSKRSGCADYIGESNAVTMTVGPGCCGNITNLYIYDQSTDAPAAGIGPITNGMVIPEADLPNDYYLAVEVNGNVESVKIKLDGQSQSTENVSPYTWPNGAEGGSNWNGGAGSYTVDAYAYLFDNANHPCDTISVNFSIQDCDNVTQAGTIGNAQTDCQGFDPGAITNVTLPTGGSGAIEYVWLKRFPGQNYTLINGANGATYDPPFISQTTGIPQVFTQGRLYNLCR